MVLPMARPWKNPETGQYYWRRRVPRDVLALAPGPEFAKKSLDTKDWKEAVRRFKKVDAQFEAAWDEIRRAGGVPAVGAESVAKNCDNDPIRGAAICLTDKQVDALAGEVYKIWWRQYDDDRRLGFRSFQTLANRGAIRSAMAGYPLQRGRTDDEEFRDQCRLELDEKVGHYVHSVLDSNGLVVDDDTHHKLMLAAGRAIVRAIDKFQEQAAGDWSEDTNPARFPNPDVLPLKPKSEQQLDSIFAGWSKKSKEPSESSVRRYRPILEDLAKFVGSTDMSTVTTEKLTAYLEHLELEGSSSPDTIKGVCLAAIKSVFKWAFAKKVLPTNPARDVFYEARRVKGESVEDRRGFYDGEADSILSATFRPPSKRMSKGTAAARRWVPWICAYTGARVAEITQLRAMDVRVIDDTWCIVIDPKAGAVKDDKIRNIPVHPHLVEQGFLGFAAKSKGAERLFYDEKAGQDASKKTPQYGQVAGRLGRWVREELGISAKDVDPNHGWRHRFKSRAILANIPERYVDQIQGHAPTSASRIYGPLEPSLLYLEICKIPRYEIKLGAKQEQMAEGVAPIAGAPTTSDALGGDGTSP